MMPATATLLRADLHPLKPLTLRHASKRSSGTWGPGGPDDYDVISDGRNIGRIFKPRGAGPNPAIQYPSRPNLATRLSHMPVGVPSDALAFIRDTDPESSSSQHPLLSHLAGSGHGAEP